MAGLTDGGTPPAVPSVSDVLLLLFFMEGEIASVFKFPLGCFRIGTNLKALFDIVEGVVRISGVSTEIGGENALY